MNNQARVTEWAGRVFTEAELCDIPERALRVLEEAIELAQTAGCTPEQCHKLIEYVMARPEGIVSREIAGVMVTLYCLAAVAGVYAQQAFERELKRINTQEVIARIQKRQAEKREAVKPPGPGCSCMAPSGTPHAGNCTILQADHIIKLRGCTCGQGIHSIAHKPDCELITG